MKIRLVMGFFLLVGQTTFSEIDQQAQGILRFNECMGQLTAKALAADRVGAADTYLELMPPSWGEEGRNAWQKYLIDFARMIQETEVESIELITVDRLSTQSYRYRYMLHGKDGPILFTAQAYQFDNDWRTRGFSYKNDFDVILADLEGKQKLRQPISVRIPVKIKRTTLKPINLSKTDEIEEDSNE